jgi:hypothetical protein
MASFFAKVGRTLKVKKKFSETSENGNAPNALLDDQRYETIEIPDSPSLGVFELQAQENHPTIRVKGSCTSRVTDGRGTQRVWVHVDKPKPSRLGKTPPLLSLDLGGESNHRRLDDSFDVVLTHGAAAPITEIMNWKTLDAKRLSMEETLALVEGCVQFVKSRGN